MDDNKVSLMGSKEWQEDIDDHISKHVIKKILWQMVKKCLIFVLQKTSCS